jgi:colanic acid biosynthesis glycosyl transferase WcaI
MKILVQSIHYAPELIGGGKYTSEMCEWLAARGHTVEVVTAYPFYPDWKVKPPYRNSRYSHEVVDGVQVHRCPFYVPQEPSGLRRLISYLSFALSSGGALIWTALRFRPDVVFAIAPTQLGAPATLAAAFVSRARSWMHLQDFEIQSAFELGLLRGKWLRRCAEFIEGGLLRRFCRVSTISPKMLELLLSKQIAQSRAIEFRNWVDTSVIRPGDRSTPLRVQLGLPESAIVALYSGSMALKQGLENVVEAARILRDNHSDIFFVLCGNGAVRDRLIDQAQGLDNVRFLDLQPRERLCELLATADMHLLPQRAAVADLVLPSKLAAMLASGRPIIAMAEPNTQLAIEVEGNGLVIPADNSAALVAAIVELAKDEPLRTKFGQAGRGAAIRRWDMQTILNQLEQHLLLLQQESSIKPLETSSGGPRALEMRSASDLEPPSGRAHRV